MGVCGSGEDAPDWLRVTYKEMGSSKIGFKRVETGAARERSQRNVANAEDKRPWAARDSKLSRIFSFRSLFRETRRILFLDTALQSGCGSAVFPDVSLPIRR